MRTSRFRLGPSTWEMKLQAARASAMSTGATLSRQRFRIRCKKREHSSAICYGFLTVSGIPPITFFFDSCLPELIWIKDRLKALPHYT
jgi:hypothetical protein